MTVGAHEKEKREKWEGGLKRERERLSRKKSVRQYRVGSGRKRVVCIVREGEREEGRNCRGRLSDDERGVCDCNLTPWEHTGVGPESQTQSRDRQGGEREGEREREREKQTEDYKVKRGLCGERGRLV